MPYPNEYSCRLQSPEKFVRFIRMEREHEGKKYDAVIGFTKGDKESDDQAYRYHKDIWTEEEVKTHCKLKKGTFEPLKVEAQEFVFVSPGEVTLSGDEHLVDIEILRQGTWQHKQAPGGVLELTVQLLREFVANFKDGICGTELPVDLGHEVDPTGAVAWLKDLYLKAKDGISHLWARLDVTDEVIQRKVKEGSLKYFSCSLDLEYEDKENPGRIYKVIKSGALTNYPYIKGMGAAIVNFSDVSPGKMTLERKNGNEMIQLEEQVKLITMLWKGQVKENIQLKKESQRLALEVKLSELGAEGYITPAEKYQVREASKIDFNAGLIVLKVFSGRVKPVIEFGQRAVVMQQQKTDLQTIIKMAESSDEKVREKGLRMLDELEEQQRRK